MTLVVCDLQSEGDLDSIRSSCAVCIKYQNVADNVIQALV